MQTLTIYTVAEAATALGKHPSYIRRLCAKHGIGQRKSERFRVLSESDLERLRGLVREPGNPQFGPDFRKNLAAAKKTAKKRRRKLTRR